MRILIGGFIFAWRALFAESVAGLIVVVLALLSAGLLFFLL
jgi:hypothetical protein